MGLRWAILGGFLAPVLPGYGLPVVMAAFVAAGRSDAKKRQEVPSAKKCLGFSRPP